MDGLMDMDGLMNGWGSPDELMDGWFDESSTIYKVEWKEPIQNEWMNGNEEKNSKTYIN